MALYCTDPALLRSESRFRKGPTRRNVNLGNGRFAMFNRERDISDGRGEQYAWDIKALTW